MRKEELRTYIENHESEMIEDLKSLIRISSEKQAAEPGKPFGAPAAEALAQGIEILEKYGFAVTTTTTTRLQLTLIRKKRALIFSPISMSYRQAKAGRRPIHSPRSSKKEKCSAAEPQTTKDRRSQLSTQCALSKNSVTH